MSMVQQAIEVSAPLHTVYEQLATFENYPRFMHGVERVTQIGNDQTHWIMDLAGHRREFDATITERSLDERVAWSTIDGPLIAETLTLRPIGETRTQVVAQLEADVAFLLPSDRHGAQTLNRRLKSDLDTFKSLCETGKLGPPGAGNKLVSGQSTIFAGGPQPGPASAAPARSKHPSANPTIGRGAGAGKPGGTGPSLLRGSGATAPMGGQAMSTKDNWGDGMINEEDRGSAHDF